MLLLLHFPFKTASHRRIPSMLCAVTYTQQSTLTVAFLERYTDALYKCGLPVQI